MAAPIPPIANRMTAPGMRRAVSCVPACPKNEESHPLGWLSNTTTWVVTNAC